ncbi:MAG: peptidase MA family metallohydrolase [Balneolaceae bacterium]
MRSLKRTLLVPLLALFIGTVAVENLYAQFFFFGKNRVQYDQFDWRFIETDHFDIYYYDAKNYHLAQFTAETVESSLKQLEEDFGSELTDRIPVIIYDSHSDFSQTNVVPLPVSAAGIGGVTDKLKNRMTQPFMGDYTDFRRTIQHELVHAFINDVYFGGTIQSIMQNNIQLQFPLWFEEGLAEFLALGWDTQTDMFMRDAILNQYLPPLTQLTGFFNYRGGQSFWFFVQSEYGRPKITEILQRVKNNRNIGQSLVQSLGLGIDELSDRWQEFYRQRYFPEVQDRQTVGSVATQLTSRGRSRSLNFSPSISPNGDRIAVISTSDGIFDVIVINANTGERIKTLVKGADDPMFEELNILIPNLTWSPDGSQLALSSQSQGSFNLAIVDYETGSSRTIRFPELDTINSVSWSPDGTKIAFDGNIGPYQNIFVYDLETGDFQDLTGDVFNDKQPHWAPDSETIYFVSNRGDKLAPHTYLAGHSTMQYDHFYQTDLYSVRINSTRINRLTNTPMWNEENPSVTADGRLLFISDRNGIPNVYEYDLNSRTSYPLTDLQSGVQGMSVSRDGSRLAFTSLNQALSDVFLMRSPLNQRRDSQLRPNAWAEMRMNQDMEERVPAIRYAREMIASRTEGNVATTRPMREQEREERERQRPERRAGQIDFRNYEFGEAVIQDTTIEFREDPRRFTPEDNTTADGFYQPREYRLRFSPDFSFAAGSFNTQFGTSAVAFFSLSDLLGDHQLAISSDLVFDLRNSNYSVRYGYLKNRTNFFATFFHQSQNFQTFFGELLRFRTFGLSVDFQYPLNRFQRFDYGISGIGISRDFSSVQAIGESTVSNDQTFFLFPTVQFTGDFTKPGFLTPQGGRRYSIQLSASPPITNDTPRFATLLGDYRTYVDLGRQTSLAFRGAGAVSLGRDSQTFFMGGMLGWINQSFSNNEIPFDRLSDTFFTLPVTPMRGHRFNTTLGDRFSLINTEFRFPLVQALLPGPIPILPLWNITGVGFVDIGAAWGFDQEFSRFNDAQTGEPITFFERSGSLDFKVAERREIAIDPRTGEARDGPAQPGDLTSTVFDGDILIGAGFGLRTILLGLPFRWDVGWPYFRDGFGSNAIHYFSLGIDF